MSVNNEAQRAVARAIDGAFVSAAVTASDAEAANVVDVLAELAGGARKIARAISADAARGTDATGGSVGSLTEAAMGITAGLVRIAEAIGDLAEAVRERP